MFGLRRIGKSVFGIALSLGLLGCNARADNKATAPPPRAVEVLTVAPGPVQDSSEYLGNVVSRQNINILPQVSGYVRKILVRPGQEVKAGDMLVELDARQEAAALDSADAQQRAAASREELAQRTLDRTQALHKEGIATGQELDQAAAAAKAADADRRAASARVSEQRVALSFHAVRAPFAGTIGDLVARVGDYVTASAPLTSITQGAMLEIEINVPSEKARSVRPGTPVELIDAAGKVMVKTKIYFVAPEADPRTQLVEMNAMFDNSVGLRPSELVRTRIIYGTREALLVPVLAIVRQSGQPFVYAVEDKPSGPIVSRRPVKLGVLTDQNYVIEQGLAAGDRIAVSSLQGLRDNAPIKPLPPKPPATAP